MVCSLSLAKKLSYWHGRYMPHIKVSPFDTRMLDGDMVRWRAMVSDGDNELVGVEYEGEPFLLEVRKQVDHYLIKPEKSTRPLDVNKIKKTLKALIESAGLDLLHENISLSPSKPPLASKYSKSIADFEDVDFGDTKIAIEVGFGSGRHLLYQALSNPDILHIGIEIHTPSAQQVLKQIELQQIDNIWVVNYDARLLLEMLPSNAASMIYVHFPVPWDKKPHRRVISHEFVAESLRVLDAGGALELRTDSNLYYNYALEVFGAPSSSHFEVRKNNEALIRSKYEDRWLRQEKDIYTLTLYCDTHSHELENDYDFSFDGDAVDVDVLLNLPRQPIVQDSMFVHFERRYRMIDGSGVLIKCAFGSFDRPEHRFIIRRDGDIYYYPHLPVRSKTNYLAHQTIRGYVLCQM